MPFYSGTGVILFSRTQVVVHFPFSLFRLTKRQAEYERQQSTYLLTTYLPRRYLSINQLKQVFVVLVTHSLSTGISYLLPPSGPGASDFPFQPFVEFLSFFSFSLHSILSTSCPLLFDSQFIIRTRHACGWAIKLEKHSFHY
jgi:hypothetical protein